jgi:hypothetical protein
MPPFSDDQREARIHPWPDEMVRLGDFRKRQQHIEHRQGAAHFLQGAVMPGYLFAHASQQGQL